MLPVAYMWHWCWVSRAGVGGYEGILLSGRVPMAYGDGVLAVVVDGLSVSLVALSGFLLPIVAVMV